MIVTINNGGVLETFNMMDDSIIASTFNTTTAYAAGDYVLQGNTIYRFNTNHAAGAWNSNEVTAVVVCDEIAGKLDSPSTAGTSGQVLTSNGSGGQSWQAVPSEVFVGATTPSGYTLYIDPDGMMPPAQGVSF